MEKPKLRPLEAFPVTEGGQMMLALKDPSGLAETTARLPPAAVAVIQLCTGDLTRDEICALFAQRYGQELSRTTLDRLLEQLDQALLLDSPRFHEHATKILTEFSQQKVRAATAAGKGYPKDPAALKLALDRWYTAANGPGAPRRGDDGKGQGTLPLAIIAPHLDIEQAGPAYAWAWRAVAEAKDLPELIVIFGTNHAGGDTPFHFTHKDYQTPLGTMQTDLELLDQLLEKLSGEHGQEAAQSLLAGEFHHRGESSIELQVVWLQHALGERASHVKILPILCAPLTDAMERNEKPTDDTERENILAALRALATGKRVVWVASAELAHVGPRFGEDEPLTRDDCSSLETRDKQTLAAVERGDADAYFEEIRKEHDQRRVTGLAAIDAMLRASGGKHGAQLVYGQCAADDKNQSIVSIVAYNFPLPPTQSDPTTAAAELN